MELSHLSSVDGEVAFDLDGDLDDAVAPVASGPIVIDADVTADHAALIARACTYRAALFEERLGGAAVTVRPRLVATAEETRSRLDDELATTGDEGRLRTDPDDDVALARGVATAVGAALGGIGNRSVAVEGFGPDSQAIAREVVSRGGRIVGVSTGHGAVADGAGLDVDSLMAAADEHGPMFVAHLDGLDLHRSHELLGLAVDALVTSGRVGSIDDEVAPAIQAEVVVPATPVPYTEAGLEVLRRHGVVALPDFATTAGPFIVATAPGGLRRDEVLGRVGRLVGDRIDSARLAKLDPVRYCTSLADTFLTMWIPAEHRPDGPALVRPARL